MILYPGNFQFPRYSKIIIPVFPEKGGSGYKGRTSLPPNFRGVAGGGVTGFSNIKVVANLRINQSFWIWTLLVRRIAIMSAQLGRFFFSFLTHLPISNYSTLWIITEFSQVRSTVELLPQWARPIKTIVKITVQKTCRLIKPGSSRFILFRPACKTAEMAEYGKNSTACLSFSCLREVGALSL